MSDAKIRELERVAFQTQKTQDIVNYWRACLRGGILPKSNQKKIFSAFKDESVWTLYPTTDWTSKAYIILQPSSVDDEEWDVWLYNNLTSRFPINYLRPYTGGTNFTLRQAEDIISAYLEELIQLDKIYPEFRENPDERIRKLERYEKKNDVQLAIEKLRAGIPLEPTEVFTDDYLNLNFEFSDRLIYIRCEYDSYSESPRPQLGDVIYIYIYVEGGGIRPWISYTKGRNFQNYTIIKLICDKAHSKLHIEQYPEVMNLLYEALNAPPQTQQRNPDEKIRKLERYKEGDDKLEAINKLRAGIPIEPKEITENDEIWYAGFDFSDRRIEVIWWFSFRPLSEEPNLELSNLYIELSVFSNTGTFIKPWISTVDAKKSYRTWVIIKAQEADVNKIFQLPQVMEKMYEALIAQPESEQRKNPDTDIRQLERRAFESEAAEDISNYWHAALRANLLPRPTFQDDEQTIWTLDKSNYYLVREKQISRIEIKTISKNTFYNLPREPREATEEKILEQIKTILRWLLTIYTMEMTTPCKVCGSVGKERCRIKRGPGKGIKKTQYYPHVNRYLMYSNRPFRESKFPPFPFSGAYRRNPDENIRNLERHAKITGELKDKLTFWRAALRANILPTPTQRGLISDRWILNKDYRVVWYRPFAQALLEDDPPEYSHHQITINAGLYEKEILIERNEPKSKVEEAIKENLRRLLKEFDNEEDQNYTNRQNPDSRIRELERIAFQNKTTEDITNYWRACFKAGIVPTATLEDRIWTLTPSNWEKQPHVEVVISHRIPENIYISLIRNEVPIRNQIVDRKQLDNLLPEYLKELLNPGSTTVGKLITLLKNPDERIRRLSRDKDKLQAAISNLRAGIAVSPDSFKDSIVPGNKILIWTYDERQIVLHIDPYLDISNIAFRMEVFPKDESKEICPYRVGSKTNHKTSLTYFSEGFLGREIPQNVWKRPLVMENLYLALVEPTKNKTKKNPDERIRRLERSGEGSELQAAIEKLRAGIPLTPTEIKLGEDIDTVIATFNIGTRIIEIDYRQLGLESEVDAPIVVNIEVEDTSALWIAPWSQVDCSNCSHPCAANERGRRRCRICGAKFIGYPPAYASSQIHFIFELNDIEGTIWKIPAVMNAMYEALLAPAHGSKRNPDERIRRLEREKDNPLQIAIESLRAGIPIIPKLIHEKNWITNGFYTKFDFEDREIYVNWKLYSAYFDVEFSIAPKDKKKTIKPWTGTFTQYKTNEIKILNLRLPVGSNNIWADPTVMETLYEGLIEPAINLDL